MFLAGDSQCVGDDQQVRVVKQGHLRPLHQQEERELDEQHQSQLPYAADVEEHGAGQQGQHYTVAEILQQTGDDQGRGGRLREDSDTNTHTHTHTCAQNVMGLTSGKWQGMAWLEHSIKASSAVLDRLCSRQKVSDVFSSLATQSLRFSLLQVNWQERTT